MSGSKSGATHLIDVASLASELAGDSPPVLLCGVWGGALFLRGVVIAEKRRRGRPRKADVAA